MIARPLLVLALVLAAAGCEEHRLSTCDITQHACQVDIYYRMLSLRGDGYDPFGGLPPVRVITEADYRDKLIADNAQAAAAGPSLGDKARTLLGLTSTHAQGGGADGGSASDAGAGSTTLDDEVANTYAYYFENRITIIAHPNQTDSHARENAMVVLAHELVHAIQDRELDLHKDDFTTSDEYLAYKAIVEGDARLYEALFTNEVRGLLALGPRDVVQATSDELALIYDDAASTITPLFLAELLVYPLGAKVEALEYASGGNAAVRHGYGKEPHRMVGFLLGDDGRAPPVSSGDACPGLYATSLPTRGQSVGADRFGALLFYAFLRGVGVDHATAYTSARSWTGDYLLVQATSDFATTAVSWRIELSTAPATAIVEALSAFPAFTVIAGARSLQITTSDSTTALTWAPLATCMQAP